MASEYLTGGLFGSETSLLTEGFWGDTYTPIVNPIRFSPYIWSSQKLHVFSIADLFFVSIEPRSISLDVQVFVFQVKAITVPVIFTHMTYFFINKGDTLPRIESILKYSDSRTVDLTGATLVQFMYKPKDGAVVTKTAAIVNATQGKVAYQWETGDTAVAGDYSAQWRITFSGGGILTIPNNGTFIPIRIVQTLG